MLDRLKLYLNPFRDGRYEDMNQGWKRVAARDFTAGLIVAMVAIPLAMGFAIASAWGQKTRTTLKCCCRGVLDRVRTSQFS
jgi:hypothetical protein